MSGTQTLIDRILAQAREEGDRLVKQADQQAAQRMQQADREAALLQQQEEEKTQLLKEQALRTARSAAAQYRRNALLTQRRALIDEAIEALNRRLLSLPEDAYFALLQKKIAAAVQPGEGTLLLNERDLARRPKSFDAFLAGLPGGVRVSTQPAAIDGGFILRYDLIEINSRFSALLSENREPLEDLFSRALFEE